MAIQAIIDKIVKDPGATVIDVTYTDSLTFKAQREYRVNSFNLEAFKAQVRAQIDAFGQVDNVDKVLFVGPFDPTAIPPSDAEIARVKFFADLTLQRQMETAIKFDLKTVDDQDYMDLVALVKQEFKPEYVGLLGII